MIVGKMNKFLLIVSLCFLTQCYTEPFFELTVKVVDQEINAVANVNVKILVQDVENGEPVEGSIIALEGTTNSTGESSFSFDNKAFVTVQVCLGSSGAEKYLCKDGAVYLEENKNKEFTLMLEEMSDTQNCDYCFED
ncbi:MAG: hypothetical protein CMP56_01280 [Flavobacteriales bacterium]|nr:hypothetical protein [Flavobacteriales bacterium]|tara:strand:+ start:1585 stop:1995 length:411 start_codon:yes stop_codon:yes gene_type:complete